MVAGLLLACAPLAVTGRLAGALCSLVRRRLRGEAVGEEQVRLALSAAAAAAAAAGVAEAAPAAAPAAAAAAVAGVEAGLEGMAARSGGEGGGAGSGSGDGGGSACEGSGGAPATAFEVEGGLFLLRELCAAFPDAAAALLPDACLLAERLAAQARLAPPSVLPAPANAAAGLVPAAAAAAAAAAAVEADERQLVLLECLWRVLVEAVKSLGRAHVKRHLEMVLAPLAACVALGGGAAGRSSSSSSSGGGARGHLLFAASRAALDCAQALADCVGRPVFAARVAAEHQHLLALRD